MRATTMVNVTTWRGCDCERDMRYNALMRLRLEYARQAVDHIKRMGARR